MAVEALVGSIVSGLASLAADSVAGQLRVAWGLEGELEKLQRLLLRIQSMLADAEEKQRMDAAVRSWLDALKKVAYEAEDVLDELNYETLRHKAKAVEVAGDKAKAKAKVRDFFSSHNPILIRLKMGRKLNNIFEEIDKIAAESTRFNFSNAQPETADPVIIDETCSFVEESEVVGRHGDKEKIVKMLVNDCNAKNVAVLPIVGMGGLGKTTMAQLIYNDPRVAGHFQLRVWVCISDNWDTKKIIQDILNLAATKKCESFSMEGLHLALREALAHKRFLIVLDDVWEEDPGKWDTLKGILNYGGKGSWVMVTTRSERVAEITGTVQNCRPRYLSEDESWNLFSKRAFATGAERSEELVEIGKDIANKCGGLPLALRMLGSLLYKKNDTRQWLKIKESSIWDIETGILPALWLSYKHLPLHAKRCFTFCAVFPKDHEMEKEELIHMWMAHGFVPSDGGGLEVNGNEIFNQLVQRSFLQDFKEKKIYLENFFDLKELTCRMHDLVHDLAQSILGNECVGLFLKGSFTTPPRDAYHLSIPHGELLDMENALKASPNLRTMLSYSMIYYNGNRNFPGSTSLRVLKLPVIRLPTSIKFLQHLRYLQLRYAELSELPASICALVNLQTLDLSRCEKLLRLPKRMACMISLRHLYLDGCNKLMIMAPDMGRMTNLQTLTLYVVSEEIGSGIGELKDLHLSSRLAIKGLGFVKDAREMNLHSKDLTALSLDWTTTGGGELNNFEQILEELKPSGCLKSLEIRGYGGSKCPKWMADRLLLQHLVQLHLEHCKGLHRLPPLWQLNSLEKLTLEHMDNLKYIISDDTSVKSFRSLKELNLRNLAKLEEWWEKRNAPLQDEEENMANCLFPVLAHMVIDECPELAGSTPSAPCLKSLELYSSKNIPLGSISGLTSLVSLEIINLEEAEHVHDPPPIDSFLPHETLALRHLQCLEELNIRASRKLALVWRHEDDEQEEEEEEEEGPGLSSLKEMSLFGCDWMFSWPRWSGFWSSMSSLESLRCMVVSFPYQALQCLKSLRKLEIMMWDNATGQSSLLPQLQVLEIRSGSGLKTVPPIWGPSLKQLSVSNCPNLVSLAAAEQELCRLTSLEILSICYCPRLESLATAGMDGLTALRSLELDDCTALTSLPERLLPNLTKLRIRKCPQLYNKFQRGGEYWSLISNIPNCKIEADEY